MSNTKGWAIFIVVLCAAGAALYFGLHVRTSRSAILAQYSNGRTANADLIAGNTSYAKGEQLLQMGKPDDAVTYFQAALPSARNFVEEGQIAYKLAAATEKSKAAGGYMAAIPLYKSIATTTRFTNITRAYAVQELGLIFYNYGDANITTQIFKDEPFKSMFVPGDAALSYRHLFEYAASLYPLAVSDLRVADWYASQIHDASSQGSGAPALGQATVASYKAVIRNYLASADKDIKRMQGNSNEAGNVPVALQREAIIYGKLQLSGDDTFGDAITTLQKVIALYALSNKPGQDGFARYYWALYLAKLRGAPAAADVKAALAPVCTDSVYTTGLWAVGPVFRKDSADMLGIKSDLLLLAGMDPQFKAYLETLGWSSQDFRA